MNTSLLSRVDFAGEKLKTLKERYVLREPINIVTQYEQEVDDLAEELILKSSFFMKIKNELLNTVTGKLEALSPLSILNRGYSITVIEKNKKILKETSQLKKKELIRTKLAKGEILSKVEETL